MMNGDVLQRRLSRSYICNVVLFCRRYLQYNRIVILSMYCAVLAKCICEKIAIFVIVNICEHARPWNYSQCTEYSMAWVKEPIKFVYTRIK